jgi:DNA polymerase V
MDRHPLRHRYWIDQDSGQAGKPRGQVGRPQTRQLPGRVRPGCQPGRPARVGPGRHGQATALGEIWGIGEQLRADGLQTSLDVARLDPATVRRRWSVVLERTVRELQGQPCIAFETVAAAKKEIACTRSFGHRIDQLKDLIEAVTHFCSRAAEKLRKQDSHAVQVLVFIHTSQFRHQDRQYSRSVTVPLRRPTADTALIAASAIRGLKAIFKPDYQYAKAGVMLLDLRDASVEQGELDFDDPGRDRGPLMSAVDAINQQHGRGAI